MLKNKNQLFGTLLICIGLVILLVKLGILHIGWGTIWPLFILIPGLILEGSFIFNRQIPGVLVPGGILTVSGLTFMVCALFGRWDWMSFIWPLFPFSVAVGLFQLYLFGGKDKSLLIPVGILGGFSVIALLTSLMTAAVGVVIPIAIILLGGYLLFSGKENSDLEG